MDRRRDNRHVVRLHDHDKRVDALVSNGWRVVGWVDGFYRLQAPRTAARGHQKAHSATNADLAGK